MASIILAGTTTGTALSLTSDTSGELQIQTNNGSTTALTLTTGGAAVFTAGTVSDPAITTTGDTNTGIFFPAADTIAFAEGGAEVARFNADAQFVAAAGTALLPVITTTGDVNTGVFFPAADTIAFTEGGVEAMRIDSSGRVGIGTSSPNVSLQVNGPIKAATANDKGVYSLGESAAAQVINVGIWRGAANDVVTDGVVTTGGNFLNLGGYGGMVFTTGAQNIGSQTERMRIDSSGNVGIGTSSPAAKLDVSGAIYATSAKPAGSNQDAAWITASGTTVTYLAGDTGSGANAIFQYSRSSGGLLVRAGGSGGVTLSSGGTAWAAVSDENQKDIIEPITKAAEKVSTLRAVIGKYKTDEEGTRRSFLIAQDVQKILPEAVDTTNPDVIGLRYTEVIPLLVAAIKELKATVDAQAAQIAALESK